MFGSNIGRNFDTLSPRKSFLTHTHTHTHIHTHIYNSYNVYGRMLKE